MTKLRNNLRCHKTAIELALLVFFIGAFTAITLSQSAWLGLAVGVYFTLGAGLLLGLEKDAPPEAEPQPEAPPLPPAHFSLGLLLGIPAVFATIYPFAWLLTAGWAAIYALPPVEILAAWLESPLAAAEIGLALGLLLVSHVLHIFFSWAVWGPVEPRTAWGRLLEAIAGSHLLALALVLAAAWQLITPAMWLFLAAVELGYIYIMALFWATERLAERAIKRVQAWRTA